MQREYIGWAAERTLPCERERDGGVPVAIDAMTLENDRDACIRRYSALALSTIFCQKSRAARW
jgi:hypothetical protein